MASIELSDTAGHAAAFGVELRPGWFYGGPKDTPYWIVERRIEVDCLHDPPHASMDSVLAVEEEAGGPAAAVAMLSAAVDRVIQLAGDRPVDIWTSQGGA